LKNPAKAGFFVAASRRNQALPVLTQAVWAMQAEENVRRRAERYRSIAGFRDFELGSGSGRAAVTSDLFDYIEMFYNPIRRHRFR
jgi:hypothetical protein